MEARADRGASQTCQSRTCLLARHCRATATGQSSHSGRCSFGSRPCRRALALPGQLAREYSPADISPVFQTRGTFTPGTNKWFDKFAAVVRKMPEVLGVYHLPGEIDYLIKLQVADSAGCTEVSQKLTALVGNLLKLFERSGRRAAVSS